LFLFHISDGDREETIGFFDSLNQSFMKKVFIVLALFTGTAVCAQTTFGIHGNVISAKMNTDSEDDEEFGDFKSRISWKLGVVADVPLSSNFSFMPQLNVLSKGAKIDMSGSEDFGGGIMFNYKVKGNVKLTYLELPLNFVYKAPAGAGQFYIGAGPSVSYGLGGDVDLKATVSYNGATETESETANVKFDGKKAEDAEDDDVHFKAVEFGANIIAGYKLPMGLLINAQANIGLSNIDPNEGASSKNTYFGLGVIYFFKGK
jgi:hypothetical protein